MRLGGIIGAGHRVIDATRMLAWRISCRANAIGREIAPTKAMRHRCTWKAMMPPPDTYAERIRYEELVNTPVGYRDDLVPVIFTKEVDDFARILADDPYLKPTAKTTAQVLSALA